MSAMMHPREHLPAPAPKGRVRVLVVDDSRAQRRILAVQLARWGYQLVEADSGEAALALSCRSHLKQIGLAFHGHAHAFGVFPSNGGWDGHDLIKDTRGAAVRVYTWDRLQPLPYVWGVGKPASLKAFKTFVTSD